MDFAHRKSFTRRLVVAAALGVIFGLGLSGLPAQAEAASPVAPQFRANAEQQALGHLGSIVTGNYAAVVGDFDPELRRQLTVDGVARAWVQFRQARGGYQSHGRPVVSPRGELSVVEVPLNMGNKPGRFQIVFHPDGRIAGLHLL